MHSAIILAAGVGSRLVKYTKSKPKALVKVCGKPIIQHQIEAFKDAGVTNIYIVIGYKSLLIKKFIKLKNYKNVYTIENKNYLNTNNMYSLWLCKRKVKNYNYLYICNGDVVFNVEILKNTLKKYGDYIVCDKANYYIESMKISISNQKYVNDINKLIKEENAFATSIDLYCFTKKLVVQLFAQINYYINIKNDKTLWMEVAIQKLVKNRNIKIKPFVIGNDDKWIEIDDEKDLIQAELTFSKHLKKLKNVKRFVLDMDGTIYLKDKVIKGAKNFINNLNQKSIDIAYLTNNSSKSKDDYIKKLSSLNIQATKGQFILSSDVTIQYFKKRGYKKGYIVGTDSMIKYFRQHGICHSAIQPQFVLLGYDTDITYKKIKKASILINNGLDYYATHSDNFCPTPDGPIPDAGSFIKMFESTTGKLPKKVFGKPSKELISHIVNKKINLDEHVLIGDRLHTDFEMAKIGGIPFICVLTGETRRIDIENEQQWPDLIVNDIGELSKYLT